MAKKVLITGGSGFVGTHLSNHLISRGHEVAILTRGDSVPEKNEYHWAPGKNEIDEKSFPFFENIIHLAGAGIADKRWTDQRKKLIISSRVDGPKFLRSVQQQNNLEVNSFISASGINAYGTKTVDKIFTEEDKIADDFLGRCCRLWEEAADQFSESRVVKLRCGSVLDRDEGAFPRIAKPIKMGFGAVLGSGKQWFPWIYIDDLVSVYTWVLEHDIDGTFNACADEHVTNKQFTIATAHTYGKKIWLPNVPGWAMKLALGKLASVVLEGSRASNEKLKETGYDFQYPTLDKALDKLTGE